MKLEKINIDGKKASIEISDKIIAAKINPRLVSQVLYKKMQITKVEKQRLSKKMKLQDQHQKYMLKKVLVMQDMLVKKLQYLLGEE